jgi:biotin operon repressor
MSINERIYRIDQLLKDRKSISFEYLKEKLEISRATLKRDIAYMRDRLNVPIIFDRELNGYRLDKTDDLREYVNALQLQIGLHVPVKASSTECARFIHFKSDFLNDCKPIESRLIPAFFHMLNCVMEQSSGFASKVISASASME